MELHITHIEGRCMNGWTNLPHNQSSYLLKILVKLWKLQLVYINLYRIPPYFFHVINGTFRVVISLSI